MYNQNKDFERAYFDNAASSGHYDVASQSYYDFLLKKLSENKIFLKGSVLEAGCGEGIFGKFLLKKFSDIKVCGVDISEKMVEIANDGTSNYSAIVGDLEYEALFPGGSFDCVFCPFILHHFIGLEPVFKNLNHWLKTGGVLICLEPNGSNVINKISNIVKKVIMFFLGKDFVVKYGLATPNEKAHSIKNYQQLLANNNFGKVVVYSELLLNKDGGGLLFRFIVNIKRGLFIVFRFLFPNSLYSGNELFILAKKIK